MNQRNHIAGWLIGCGVVAVLCFVGCAGLAVYLFNKGRSAVENLAQGVQQEIAAEQRRSAFFAGWQAPPADTPDENLLPQAFGKFQRRGAIQNEPISDYGINLPARTAEYASADLQARVFVLRATELEWEAIVGRVKQHIAQSQPMRRTVLDHGQRFYFYISPENRLVWLYWKDDWVFVFRTPQDDEMAPLDDFIQAYLTAIQPAK